MSVFEAKKKKKVSTYDLKILGWILGFVGKYRTLFALSFLLMLATAALEITIPYLTKIAVDNHIYPTWSRTERGQTVSEKELWNLSEKDEQAVLRLRDGGFLADFSKLSSARKEEMEQAGVKFSNTKYVLVDPADFSGEQRDRILEIISKNAAKFERVGEIAFISYPNLKNLEKKEISLIRSKQTHRLKTLALYIFLCITGVFVFTSAFTYLLHYSGHRIMHDIRSHTLSHLLSLPQKYFDRNPVGRITTRVTNDVNAINEMYTSVLIHFVKDIIIVIGILVIMFKMNVHLTLIIVALTVFLIFVVSIFRMKLRRVYREIRTSIARLNSFVQESVRGIVLLKLYGKEKRNFEKFREINRENYEANIRQLWVYVIFRPSIEYASIAATAIILWYGAVGVMNLDFSLGALLAFFYYVRMIFKPIQELSEKYNVFQSAVAASENLYEVLAQKPETDGTLTPADTEGSLEFRNVWFSYNEKEWVLKDVSFLIKPGETTALVGITGSGKTTVANLILKFYKPQRGQILFNGTDIQNLSNRYLRENVTAIFQDLFLFGKDIFTEKTDQTLSAPARAATLSSGENQARSIEKAFGKKSKLLIMDEATSHLDAEMEKRIQDTIKQNPDSQTRLIITHRLATLRNTDNIIVIHKGKVAEQGTHKDLVEGGNIYSVLYDFLKKTGLKDRLRNAKLKKEPGV